MAARKKTKTFRATANTPWLKANETGELDASDPKIDWYVKGGVFVPEDSSASDTDTGGGDAD